MDHDHVFCHRTVSTSDVQWSDVDFAATVVRGTARVILGPLLFILYTAEIDGVVASRGMRLHQYADDCTPMNDVQSAVDRFSCCLDDVYEAWMTASRLRLNATKT